MDSEPPSCKLSKLKAIRQPQAITLETKKKILADIDSGQRQCEIMRKYGLSSSTVATIIQNRIKIDQGSLPFPPDRKRMRIGQRAGLKAKMAIENDLICLQNTSDFRRVQDTRNADSGKALKLTKNEFQELKNTIELQYSEDENGNQNSEGSLCQYVAGSHEGELSVAPEPARDLSADTVALTFPPRPESPTQQILKLILQRQEEKKRGKEQELQLRREELALQREMFEASRAERQMLLTLLHKLIDKLR